jgi:hypothetical protein
MALNGTQTHLSVYLLHNAVFRTVIPNVNSLSRLYATVAKLQHKEAVMCRVMLKSFHLRTHISFTAIRDVKLRHGQHVGNFRI